MDRDLVERAMAGDHDAFSELARVSIGRLFVIARLILRDEERAEDATQEALIRAWRDLSALRDPDRFEPWLRRLLVRACYREASAGRRRSVIEGRVRPLDGVMPDPGIGLADRDQLERGFRRLDAEQRAILVFHHYLGLSLSEIAETLGVPIGTVKSRFHRATQSLRAALEADARTPAYAGGPTS